MREEAVVVLRLDTGDLPAKSQQAAQSLQKIGTAGEISARQTAFAMRQLPAQLTDVATQLAGGANPLLVLLQQGGQVKDSFGGIGPAIRGIGAAINPVTLGIGALGLAAYKGSAEAAKLRDTLALTGNAAGLTGDRMTALAERVAAASQQTVGSAREIALALAATGRTSAGVIESQAKAAARIADLSGESAAKIASTFAAQLKEPAKFAADLNEAYNFLTVAQFKRIQQLEREGKVTEAAVMTNELLTKRLEGQRNELGLLERSLDAAAKSWSSFWQAVKGIGVAETTLQKLASKRDEIQNILNASGGKEPAQGTLSSGRIQALRAQVTLLAELAKQERSAAEQASAAALKNRVGIAKALETKPAEFSAIRTAQEQYRADFLRSEREFYDELDAQRKKDIEKAYERSLIIRELLARESREQKEFNSAAQRQQDEYLQDLRDAVTRASLEQIEDERKRGEALIQLDLQIARRRLKAKGLGAGATDEAARLLEDKAAYEVQALGKQAGENTYNDVRGALSAAFRDSKNPAKAFASALGEAVYTRLTASMADALATAAVGKTGSGGAWGDLLNFLGSISGGLTVDTGGFGTNNTGDSLPTRGGSAMGTNYVPRTMIVKVHQGEAIVPRKYNPAAGGREPSAWGGGGAPLMVSNYFSVPPGQSPAAYAAAVAGVVRQSEAKMLADAARPGRPMNNAIRAGA